MAYAVLTPQSLLSVVWPFPVSLATTPGISVDFSSYGYLDVSVPHVPRVGLWIYPTLTGSSPAVFPHSEICGSTLIYSYPQLIAVSHVLLRLLMPRHSPCALISLTFSALGSLDNYMSLPLKLFTLSEKLLCLYIV